MEKRLNTYYIDVLIHMLADRSIKVKQKAFEVLKYYYSIVTNSHLDKVITIYEDLYTRIPNSNSKHGEYNRHEKTLYFLPIVIELESKGYKYSVFYQKEKGSYIQVDEIKEKRWITHTFTVNELDEEPGYLGKKISELEAIGAKNINCTFVDSKVIDMNQMCPVEFCTYECSYEIEQIVVVQKAGKKWNVKYPEIIRIEIQ